MFISHISYSSSVIAYNLNIEGRRLHNLGVDMYVGNNQFRVNKKLACDLFSKSVRLKFLKSYYYLSLCHRDGIIEKYPVNKAIKLLTDAIDKGMRYYDLELADLYIRYKPKSAHKIENYLKSHLVKNRDEWGNRNFYLGYLYLIGLSKEINKSLGVKYLFKSMINGNIYALSFFTYIAENGVYLNGKLNKKFSQEAKKTILIFNSLGYKLLKENYSIAKQSNLSISYEKAVDYLKENNFFNQNLKNNEMHDIENILKNPNP
jgi:TPR repeat protein